MSAGSFACSCLGIINVLSGNGLMLSKQKYHTGGRYHFAPRFSDRREKTKEVSLLKKHLYSEGIPPKCPSIYGIIHYYGIIQVFINGYFFTKKFKKRKLFGSFTGDVENLEPSKELFGKKLGTFTN